jgi:hypothetical protein
MKSCHFWLKPGNKPALSTGVQTPRVAFYQVNGLEGAPTLAWRYRVLRLWQMPAEALLATDRVAPLALVGQTQITHPEVTLPAVVARMRRVAEGEQRGRLLTAFLALLPDEEMVSMVERVLEEEDLLLELDLPYLRRLREKSRTEGRAEGRAEGGAEMLLRLLHVRFGPLSEDVTARVNAADPETLLHWSERVLSASTLDAVFAE